MKTTMFDRNGRPVSVSVPSKESAAAKRSFSDDIDLRHPYYEAGDALDSLTEAAEKLGDLQLLAVIRKAKKALADVYLYMNENLIWD